MRTLLFAALVFVAGCQVDDNTSTVEQGVLTGIGFTPVSGQNLGSVQVGQSSAPFSITAFVQGTLDASYTINSIAGCPDFSIDAPGLPADIYRTCISTCTGTLCTAFLPPTCIDWDILDYAFTTTFHPTVPGPASCAITLQTSIGAKTYTINGTGTVPPLAIDVSPTAIGFGDVRRNTASSAQTVNVRNAGGGALAVSGVTISTGFAITAGPTGAYAIPVGATQAYSVTCNPTTTGALTGVMRVSSNDPAKPTSTVNLTCNGIDSNLDITPSPAAVPTTRVGEPGQTNVMLKNSGTAPMTVQSATLTGVGLTATGLPAANSTIAVNGTVTSTIKFDAATAGDAAGVLTINYDGNQVRTINVSAKALMTSMSLSPDGTVDLGAVCMGQSNAQDVTIAANAAGGFKVSGISAVSSPFSLTAPALPATVQGSGANHLTVSVTAAPTVLGPATQSVTVTTDIPGASPRTLDLSVTGLMGGVSATPQEIDLGPSMINATTIGQEIVVTNCSTTPATLSNPRLEGTDPGDFAIVKQPALTIDANGSVTWLVIAQPHSVGNKSAMFSVDTTTGTVSVLLSTDGLRDPGATGGTPDPRGSYYSDCSAGSGSASLPVGLVIGALVLRRRRHR